MKNKDKHNMKKIDDSIKMSNKYAKDAYKITSEIIKSLEEILDELDIINKALNVK